MKIFFNKIMRSLGLIPKQKYAGWNIDEWYFHYRRERYLDEKKIIAGLNHFSEKNVDLLTSNIDKFYLGSISPVQLCLCSCLFSLKKTVSNEVIKKMKESLSHNDELVRRFSAIALSSINTVESLSAVVEGNLHGHAIRTEAEKAVFSLIKLIEYKEINWRSHFAASEALASIGEAAKNELLERLDSNSKSTRYFCANALKEMNNDKMIQKRIEYILENDIKQI